MADDTVAVHYRGTLIDGTGLQASSKGARVKFRRGKPPKGYVVPAYAPWRQLCIGNGPVVIAVGPLAGTYIESFEQMDPATRPNFWAVAELPLERNPLPPELLEQIRKSSLLCVAEEHVPRGGFASELTLHLAERGVAVPRFVHLHARAHHYDRYGSQPFLRRLSSLDPPSMLMALNSEHHD